MFGQRSFATLMSKTRSPTSSCAPCVAGGGSPAASRVNGPNQLFAVGQRAPATNEVQLAR